MSEEAEPVPPEHLQERGQELWSTLAAAFDFDAWQVPLVRLACEAADRAEEARLILAEEGLVVTDRYGQMKPHPALAVEQAAALRVARLVRDLGVEPADAVPASRSGSQRRARR